MGVPLDFWIETMKKHPALYRFEGLGGNRHNRSSKDSFFKDVREACVASEEFMNDYMEKETKFHLKELEAILAQPPPPPGVEDDCYVEHYADFLRFNFWRRWEEPGNINLAPARKIIEELEPKEGEKSSVDRWGRGEGPDHVRDAWASDYEEPQIAWDAIRQDEPEYYLKEHPPIEMWSHAYEQGIPLDEILMICPGCNREPIQEKNMDRDPVRYYCGLCGAEACPDEGETLESWAEAVGVKLWPFREERKGKKRETKKHQG